MDAAQKLHTAHSWLVGRYVCVYGNQEKGYMFVAQADQNVIKRLLYHARHE